MQTAPGGPATGTEPMPPFVEPVGRPWGRVFLAVLVVALLVALVVLGDFRSLSLDQVRDWILGTGVWAPLAYVVLFAVAAVVVAPGTLLLVVAGLLFPLAVALPLAWFASVVAACAAFLVGRTLGRGFVARLVGGRMARLDDHVAAHGFRLVLAMRLALFPPYNMLNYAAGLTRVRFRAFLAATALGMVPYVTAVVLLVNRIGGAPTLRDVVTDPVLYASIGLVVIVVGLAHRLRGRAAVQADASDP